MDNLVASSSSVPPPPPPSDAKPESSTKPRGRPRKEDKNKDEQGADGSEKKRARHHRVGNLSEDTIRKLDTKGKGITSPAVALVAEMDQAFTDRVIDTLVNLVKHREEKTIGVNDVRSCVRLLFSQTPAICNELDDEISQTEHKLAKLEAEREKHLNALDPERAARIEARKLKAKEQAKAKLLSGDKPADSKDGKPKPKVPKESKEPKADKPASAPKKAEVKA